MQLHTVDHHCTCSYFLGTQALLICGGVNFDQNGQGFASDKCYILDIHSSRLFATMSSTRAFAASLITNENSLWVTGGLDYDYPSMYLSSTEYILKTGESVKGPELPLTLGRHHDEDQIVADITLITINSTFSMLIGGETYNVDEGTTIDLTYYFDHYNQAWFDGPRLNRARYFHGAGIVTDLITREKLVVVTGGAYYDEEVLTQVLDSTEMSCFLDLPDELNLKVLSYAETVDISVDNSLFQTVNLSGKYVKTDLIRTVLDKGCKNLNLSDSSIWGNLSLIQNSQLKELDLSNCRATTYYSTSGVSEELVKSCDSLQKLSLIGLKFTPKMVSSICKNSQTLQLLNLYYSNLEEEWYCKIIKTCRQIKQLVIEEHTKMNLSESGL